MNHIHVEYKRKCHNVHVYNIRENMYLALFHVLTTYHIFFIFSTGLDAYDDWLYCVNYSVVGMSDVNKTECTNGLQTTLTSLESNTLYRFVVSAIGPGGERVPPDVSVFRTKPVGMF